MAGKSPASQQSIASGKTAPKLIPIGKFAGKPEVTLSRTVTLIGSGAQSRLQLISSTVSKSHALVVNCNRGPYVRDLASRTKVLVNDQEVREAVMAHGDSVQFGKFAFTFNEGPGRLDEDLEDAIIPGPPASAAVEVTGVDTPIPLNERCLLIGRRDTCDIVISDEAVSTAHAVIFEMDGQRFVRDLGSRTGTFINGKQVHQAHLSLGDTVRVGSIDLKYVPAAVEVEEPADEQDELDALVRTDNLGTDAMAAAAADDIAEAQERAAARSMRPRPEDVNGEPEAEALPVEVEQPADSLDVIPLEQAAAEDLLAPAVDEMQQAAAAPLPDEVAQLEELTVDDLMEGGQSVDDLAPVSEDVEARVEPALDETVGFAPEAEAQADFDIEPVAEAEVEAFGAEVPEIEVEAEAPAEREPVEPTAKPFDGNLSMLDLPEPEIPEARVPRGAPVPLGQAGPLEIAPLVDLGQEALGAAEKEPVAQEPFQAEPELAPVGEAGPTVEPFDIDDALGIAAAEADETIEDQQQEAPTAAEMEAEALEADVPVSESVEDVVPAEAETASPGLEPLEVAEFESEQEQTFEPVAESPADVAGEPAAAEEWADEDDEALDEADAPLAPAVAPAPVSGAPATPPVAPVVAPVFEEQEEEEDEEEADEEVEYEAKVEQEGAAALRFDVPPASAPVEEPVAPPLDELPLEAAPDLTPTPALDFSAPVESDEPAALAPAGGVDEALPLDLNLAPTDEITLPGVGGAVDELKLDLPIDEAAAAAPPLDLTTPEIPLEPLADMPLAEPEVPTRPRKRPPGRKPRKAAEAAAVPPLAPVAEKPKAEAPKEKPEAPPARKKDVVAPPPAPAGEPVAEAPRREVPVAEAPPPLDVESIPPLAVAPAAAEEAIAPPVAPEPLPVVDEEPIGLAGEQGVLEARDEGKAPPAREAPLGRVEVIEESEPSAMEIGEELDRIEVAESTSDVDASAISEAAALTDTRFGRAMDEFTGESTTGPLIEESPAAAASAPVEEFDLVPAPEPAALGEVRAPQFGPEVEDVVEVEPDIIDVEPEPVAEQQAPSEEELGLGLEPPAPTPPTVARGAPPRPMEQVKHRGSLGEESLADILGEDETDEVTPALGPMAGFASFNTLTRELDLSEPTVEGLPALEPGAERKFKAHAHEQADSDLAGATLEDVLNEALGSVVPPAAPVGEPIESPALHAQGEPLVDEPAPVDVLGSAQAEPLVDTGSADADVLAAEIEVEPLEVETTDVEATAQLIAEAPAAQRQPPAPPRPPRPVMGELNWGANQEHFLGGMPLSLGDLSPQAALPPTAPPLVARVPGPRPAPAGQPGVPAGAPAEEGAPPSQFAPPAAAPTAHPGTPTRQPPAGPPPLRGPRGPGVGPLGQPMQRPQQRQRPAPKPRVPAGMGLIAPPTQARQTKQVSTGFDGLAGQMRHVDVFSQLPTPIGGGRDPFGAGGGAGAPPADEPFGRPRGRGPGGPGGPGGPPGPGRGGGARGPQQQPPVPTQEPGSGMWEQQQRQQQQQPAPLADDASTEGASAIEEAPEQQQQPPPPPKKKRRWFGIIGLLLLMFPAMGATAGGIWYLVPQQAQVTGQLEFTSNFKKLTEFEKEKLGRQQRELLFDEQVRRDARGLLGAIRREASPGFLESPVEFAKIVQAARFDLENGVYTLSYAGTDAENDPWRMQALLKALYNGNRSSVGEIEKLRQEVESLTRARETKEKEVKGYQAQLSNYLLAAESRPDAGEQTRLESEATRLDGEYREAILNVAKLSADIDKLKAGMPATAPSGAGLVVPLGVAPTTGVVDTTLAQYERDLHALQQRITTVKELRSKKAAEARKALDAAADAFQKQIEQAQGAIKDNPTLSKYFASAQDLKKQMLELTEQHLARSQEHYSKLSELKGRMEEKMAARRDDAMKNDPKLKEYLDQKAIKTRQHNAAVGAGYTKEAGELKADLDLLEQMIKARQTQLGDDALFADAIEQLQKIIETTQAGIESDRRETARILERHQIEFTKNQPAKDALPEDQKKLAGELETRLASLVEARRAYTDAAEQANAQADEEIRQMEANATALNEKIGARKRQIAAEREGNFAVLDARERAETLKQKEIALAKALAIKDIATNAHNAAQARLADLRKRLTAAREAGTKRDELTRVSGFAERELEQLTSQLELKNHLLGTRAQPIEPNAASVDLVQPDTKQRQILTLASAGGVGAVFCILILMNIAGSRRANRMYAQQWQQQQAFDEMYPPEAAPGAEQRLGGGDNGDGSGGQYPGMQAHSDEVAYEESDPTMNTMLDDTAHPERPHGTARA